MEPNGTERIFRRSEILYDLRYTGFLGDGDSKLYARVQNVEPASVSAAAMCKRKWGGT